MSCIFLLYVYPHFSLQINLTFTSLYGIFFLSSLSGYQMLGPSIAQALISVHLWTMFLLCNKIESKQCNVDVTLLFHIEEAKLFSVFV